ncbi:protein ANTI-SILENCING 1 isoform X2 [Jatropha curcas]|uniref:protein ANTI-SILENCING 1 isoform X2 n=1 Tax=Jatropha curcas TaxID=180498 RepID=UPI0009D64A49|nr:protein ANTI-SILENCING 1 isoform X2 [Jatropha curcas]
MLLHKDPNGEKAHIFKWGVKRGVGRTNKDIHFYESFTYHGVEYFLYDCVHFQDIGTVESYIGKLVKIYETPTHEKKVKVVWFFRPGEIRNFLGDYEPRWNEIFLASGEGKGLSNINHLEAIVDKCNVICASSDKRNPQPTEQELKLAEYIFYCSFDVRECKILKNFADHIDGIKVEHFFNKTKDKVISQPTLKLVVKGNGHEVRKESKEVTAVLGEQEDISYEHAILSRKSPNDSGGTGPSKIPCSQVDDKAKKVRSYRDSFTFDTSNIQPHKKRKLSQGEREGTVSNKVGPRVALDRGAKTVGKVTTRPDSDKRHWFKETTWGDKLRMAEEAGTLVLLENLDRSITSSEIEDLLLHALNQRVQAKVIHHSTFSSPQNDSGLVLSYAITGKCLVIFESKDAADSSVSKLQRSCLMMAGGRPLVCSTFSLRDPAKPATFMGHICLSRIKRRQSEEMRKAVSTSHFSQPNTVEHVMAMDWRVLQEKSDNWWKQLHMRQAKEIEDARNQLRMNYDN